MSKELILDDFRVDMAVDQILAHESTVTDNRNTIIFGESLGRWRGLPKNDQFLKDRSPFLWIWEGNDTYFKKQGVENMAPEGRHDLQFILAQYLPKFDENEIRDDIFQKKNQLLKKFERTLMNSKFGTKDAMTFPPDGSWEFANGPNIVDTEKFYYGGIGQIFPFTGLPLPKDWYISVLTCTLNFDNRNHSD